MWGGQKTASSSNFARIFGTFSVETNIIMRRHEVPCGLPLNCVTLHDLQMPFSVIFFSSRFLCIAFGDNYVKAK